MAADSYEERTLKETPTWAVALVCAAFVLISILIEHGINSLAKWFQKKQKKAMSEALEKIKAELMILGFISLLITIGTKPIAQICISKDAGNMMLPCKSEAGKYEKAIDGGDHTKRRLMSVAHRVLAAAEGDDYCTSKNKVPLITASGLHQLHIFIFVLAVLHVLYCVITIVLSQAKMKRWKAWEREISSQDHQFTNDPSKYRFTHQLSFIQRHTGLSNAPGVRWIVAFFRQFFASVTKVDYTTLRHGFINAHFSTNSKFDFHKYIKRSMEDDFKVVVGISFPLWMFAIIFLFLNVYKWYSLSWLSFVPLVTTLLVGAKLEVIIMDMAQQIRERTTVVLGAPKVEPSNKYFWFNRPQLILFIIHLTLFQNAFQMAYFLWIWYEFGLYSCFHENLPEIIARVSLGIALQFICSYITFPLYSFVTQMGSHMKTTIFEEQTAKALKKWQKSAKDKKVVRKVEVGSSSGENTPKHGSIMSPSVHLLQETKARSGMDIESATASPHYQATVKIPSPLSAESKTTYSNHHNQQPNDSQHNLEFTFVKL